MPDNNALQENPLIQALQIVFGRSELHMSQMRGAQPPGDKPVNLDTIENNLSRIFVGYADIQMDRQTKYRDYERMDVQSTEFQTALDIYAEECSQKDQKTGLSVWVESDTPEIAAELNGMFQRIKLDEKAYGIYRNIAKFGDTYTFNILGAYGVHGIQFIHPSRVERIQQDGLQGFKCPELTRALPPSNKDGIYSPWDFCHFRLIAYDQESLYGRSMGEPIRKVWKQYSMVEQMVVLYRLTKAVQRNIFYVDVGQASVEEAQILTQKYEKFLKNKTTFVDTKTGDFKVDFNPATMLQDIIWPIRPGSASKVEPLQNTMNIGPLVDLEHFATKMRIGLGVPKEYFDGEQSPGWNSKEALQLQDARFARKVSKLQNAFKIGIVGLCQIHYAITKQQYLPSDAFTVHLGSISDNTERLREEVLLRKAQVLEILTNVAVTAGWNRQVWSDYLLDEVFPLPVEFRKKLFTMDPVEKRRAEMQIKAGKTPDGKNPVDGKPPRKVTADNLKMGFRSFGYGEAKEVDELSPEILEEYSIGEDILIKRKSLEEKEELYADINKKYASPSGYSESEIKQLIQSRDSITVQLNEATTVSNTKWAKETDWKAIYKLGLDPMPEAVNSINDKRDRE